MYKKHLAVTLPNTQIDFFPDKLKDLNGHQINVSAAEWGYNTVISPTTGEVLNYFILFLEIIQQYMNASITLIELAKGWQKRRDFYEQFIAQQNLLASYHYLDLIITDAFNYKGIDNTLQTYRYKDWCYLAPLPPKIKIYEQILIRPLEKTTWIYLVTTVGLCAVVWRLHLNLTDASSHWDFLFAVFGYFIGQSTNLKT